MSRILPPDEMAAMSQLGPRTSSYSFQRVQGILSLFAFSFMAVSMGIIGLPLSVAAFIAFFARGVWIAVRGFVTCYRQVGLTVYLYSGGLILVKGSKARPIRWEQVRDVQEREKRPRIRGISGAISYPYTVQLTNGE